MVYDQSVATQDTVMQKAVEKTYCLQFVKFIPVEIWFKGYFSFWQLGAMK